MQRLLRYASGNTRQLADALIEAYRKRLDVVSVTIHYAGH